MAIIIHIYDVLLNKTLTEIWQSRMRTIVQYLPVSEHYPEI